MDRALSLLVSLSPNPSSRDSIPKKTTRTENGRPPVRHPPERPSQPRPATRVGGSRSACTSTPPTKVPGARTSRPSACEASGKLQGVGGGGALAMPVASLAVDKTMEPEKVKRGSSHKRSFLCTWVFVGFNMVVC